MLLIQFTGLSGSGKSTIANSVADELIRLGHRVEVIDGDSYRKEISKDLGFSKADRFENIRRLFFVGKSLVKHDVIVLMAVINAYEEIRSELSQYEFVKTVYLDCPLNILIERDTKGLYKRAFLSDRNEAKINNLTGVNDPFEIPENPDLVLYTAEEDIKTSSEKLLNFILGTLERGK